jgi:hypothetical protein
MSNTDLVIGLKTNCSRGYSLANYWQETYEKTLTTLVKSWSVVEDTSLIEPLIWETLNSGPRISTVINSSSIGVYSTIRDMIIEARDYTTKKGVVKHKPEERIPSHYATNGKFLGRVSALGDKPISFEMKLGITDDHFKVKANLKGITVFADCFEVKPLHT